MYTALIGFFLVAIVTSFLCSLWEAVLLSITPSYAQIKLQEGKPIGRHLDGSKWLDTAYHPPQLHLCRCHIG